MCAGFGRARSVCRSKLAGFLGQQRRCAGRKGGVRPHAKLAPKRISGVVQQERVAQLAANASGASLAVGRQETRRPSLGNQQAVGGRCSPTVKAGRPVPVPLPPATLSPTKIYTVLLCAAFASACQIALPPKSPTATW